MTFQLIDGVIDNTAAFHRIIDPLSTPLKYARSIKLTDEALIHNIVAPGS